VFKIHTKNGGGPKPKEKDLELIEKREIFKMQDTVWGSEAAEILGISRTTFYNRQREGEYDSIHYGVSAGGNRYYKKDVFRAAFPTAGDEQLNDMLLRYNLSKSRKKNSRRRKTSDTLKGYKENAETTASGQVYEQHSSSLLENQENDLNTFIDNIKDKENINYEMLLKLLSAKNKHDSAGQDQIEEIKASLDKMSRNVGVIRSDQGLHLLLTIIPLIVKLMQWLSQQGYLPQDTQIQPDAPVAQRQRIAMQGVEGMDLVKAFTNFKPEMLANLNSAEGINKFMEHLSKTIEDHDGGDTGNNG